MAAAAAGDFMVMGIVNVTPDSFSDGGLYLDAGAAIDHALALEADGAAILDIGGESTRPGAEPGGAGGGAATRGAGDRGPAGGRRRRADLDRHLQGGRGRGRADAGATLVNDVTALRGDPAMAELVAARAPTAA